MYANYEAIRARVPLPVLGVAAALLVGLTAYFFSLPAYVVVVCVIFGVIFFASTPLLDLMYRRGVRPNHLTLGGCVLSVAAAVLFVTGRIAPGLLVTIAATGILDVWDGLLARRYHLRTRFGAVLDSTLDRLSDALIFGGVTFHLFRQGSVVAAAVALYVALTAQVVSYVRARAETQIPSCEVNFFGGRPERIFFLCFFGLIGHIQVGLILIALLQSLTIARRLAYTYRELNRYETEESVSTGTEEEMEDGDRVAGESL